MVILNQLRPGTCYEYQAGWVATEDDVVLDWDTADQGEFLTNQPDADATRFFFGSCCYRFVGLDGEIQDDRADKIFAEMSSRADTSKPDFVLFGGDQVYADSMYMVGAATTREDLTPFIGKVFPSPIWGSCCAIPTAT